MGCDVYDSGGERAFGMCRHEALGPLPTAIHAAALQSGATVPLQPDRLGGLIDPARMVRRQRLVEANRWRAVVESVWSETSPDGRGAGATTLRWRYIVDRHGRIFVRAAVEGVDRARPLTWHVQADGSDRLEWDFDTVTGPSMTRRVARAATRIGPGDVPSLVWLIPGAGGAATFRSLRGVASGARAALFTDRDAPDVNALTAVIVLLPTSSDMNQESGLIADILQPADLLDAGASAFDPAAGLYRVVCPASGLRFDIGADQVRRVHPLIELTGTSDREVAATANGRLLDASARTARGNVLLELPEIDRTWHVEIRVR
ncbi:MAG: hypothetical protein V3T70_09145, partial [Phycisphaerae bacterium]